ncbi:helix-turn-helix transcriptional regulator [Escherichia coli]|uniref:AraC family transcriptional regulator n=1 Tax=Escherichia coli TaxID=562 RepID=UPI000BE5E988|nr:AraC family transcriptional regulator [Escherichia coli]EFC9771127.1 helix-turn-helix domain-containing protein [Escherichia coli]EFH3859987.1 helix-turn-helix domain-containing protein [Escherichia coli]EFH3874706.1 helix-turn-helix domain-containing protein [Escherichia coli]EGY0319859.1 helix-turn-helix transcriptional regulator [Escherichia coli]EIY9332762.1 helix-turn-helix transcriptional regulator [Escherichia coli]
MNKKTSMTLNNICINKFMIIYLGDCRISVVCNGVRSNYIEGDLIFLHKGVNLSVSIEKADDATSPLYYFLVLDNKMLTAVKNILHESGCGININYANDVSSKENKITTIHTDKKMRAVFFKALQTQSDELKILKISYIILTSGSRNEIIMTLFRSNVTLFSDRIRHVIGDELHKCWRLSHIADLFNISEITVRKRLEAENTTFHDIILNCRMNKSLELISQGDAHINKIARDVGFSSVSYFIKVFKGVYGVTPKKLASYLKY